jgi:hypothetical protein
LSRGLNAFFLPDLRFLWASKCQEARLRCSRTYHKPTTKQQGGGRVQFEQFNVSMYHKLGLKHEQKQTFADLWHRWVQCRQQLQDRQAALAHSLHTVLPGLADVPAEFLGSLQADFVALQQPTFASWFPLSACQPLGRVSGHTWAHRLLGASPSATSMAGSLMLQLQQLLTDDALYSKQLVDVILGVGRGLNPRQALSLHAATIESEGSLFDLFKFAQLASSEQRHLAALAKAYDGHVV